MTAKVYHHSLISCYSLYSLFPQRTFISLNCRLLIAEGSLVWTSPLFARVEVRQVTRKWTVVSILLKLNSSRSEHRKFCHNLTQVKQEGPVIWKWRKQFTSGLLTRETKTKIYITLVRPGLTYGCEAWTLTKTDEAALGTFERKILRNIYGSIKERGEWRIRYNHELYQLFKENRQAYDGRFSHKIK
jgi:hypothetical protein